MNIHQRKRGETCIIVFPIRTTAGALISAATGLDSELSWLSDTAVPGSFADCTNEATEIGSTGIYYLTLTASEMMSDYVLVRTVSSSASSRTEVNLIDTRFAAGQTELDALLSSLRAFGLPNLDREFRDLRDQIARVTRAS